MDLPHDNQQSDRGNSRCTERGKELGKDKSAPVSIGAGETKEVFGIRASKGTATGYQGQCTWIGASGSLTLSIEVPYSKDNKSSLKVSGMYNIDGWKELPSRGHHFNHLLTITKVD